MKTNATGLESEDSNGSRSERCDEKTASRPI